MLILAPNEGVHMETAFLRAKIAVVAIVWTRLKANWKNILTFENQTETVKKN